MNTQIMHLQMTELYSARFTFTDFNLLFSALNLYKFMMMLPSEHYKDCSNVQIFYISFLNQQSSLIFIKH